jgi:hypothetical protein
LNDSSSFEDFINGLDLPDPDEGDPIPASYEDRDEVNAQRVEHARQLIHSVIQDVEHQGPREWSRALSGLQLLIRDEILQHIAPRPGALDPLTKDEVALSTGHAFITLAWLIYDRVAPQLAPPQEDDDELEF